MTLQIKIYYPKCTIKHRNCLTKFLLLFSLLNLVHGLNHCKTHRYAKSINSTAMQFTKEAINKEYAVLGEFKSLHCCAKGYRSIEWFKNDIPYPWSNDVSSFILYPEASNQTIYTRSTSFEDVGNYSCMLSNDELKTTHLIELNVQDDLPDYPLPTFNPQDQFVALGEPTRLYCEAFVGKVRLPDARSFISWYQVFENEQEHKIIGESQVIVTREDDQIVGAYLIIPKVDVYNYGRYVCRIEIGDAAHRLEMSAWIFGTPTKANENSNMPPFLLAFFVVLLVIAMYAAIKQYFNSRHKNQCQAHIKEEFRIRSI